MPRRPLPRQYPPFGFSVWFDRHHGHRWCWRERKPKGNPDDVTRGADFRSRNEAIDATRRELRRRGERDGRGDAPPGAVGSG